ncbi:MAG TPA: TM2 domain-containing protein [Candidatus Angelobacter sp.]|nr:TM2 domain-containing protein [Candidatus Angelobacter sp.]
MATMVYCSACGKQIHETAASCPSCGAVQQSRPAAAAVAVAAPPPLTDKRILPAFLLCFFIGLFGAHRFYVGKTGTAIAQIFTIGGLGFWTLFDLILIVTGSFTDKNGMRITQWT